MKWHFCVLVCVTVRVTEPVLWAKQTFRIDGVVLVGVVVTQFLLLHLDLDLLLVVAVVADDLHLDVVVGGDGGDGVHARRRLLQQLLALLLLARGGHHHRPQAPQLREESPAAKVEGRHYPCTSKC